MEEKATLAKFGQYEHMCQLRDEGLLYLNNLPYFWKTEDEELRGDPFDGVSEVLRGSSGTVTSAGSPRKPMKVTSWVIRVYPPQAENTNIFCMCAVRPLAGSFPVDERNLRFGSHALVMTNAQEFIDRIASQLKSKNITGKADLVEYVDENYKGDVGPFRKLTGFAYQSEWRLICYDGPGGPRKLRIGSIRDICTIVRNVEVNQKISEFLTMQSS
ncbi:MAG: hypothetical protein ACC628_19135 [Pirellulaceae bacterium]